MKDFIEKCYTFTLVFAVLAVVLFIFRGNESIVNVILGAFVGLIAASTVKSKNTSINTNTTTSGN